MTHNTITWACAITQANTTTRDNAITRDNTITCVFFGQGAAAAGGIAYSRSWMHNSHQGLSQMVKPWLGDDDDACQYFSVGSWGLEMWRSIPQGFVCVWGISTKRNQFMKIQIIHPQQIYISNFPLSFPKTAVWNFSKKSSVLVEGGSLRLNFWVLSPDEPSFDLWSISGWFRKRSLLRCNWSCDDDMFCTGNLSWEGLGEGNWTQNNLRLKTMSAENQCTSLEAALVHNCDSMGQILEEEKILELLLVKHR